VLDNLPTASVDDKCRVIFRAMILVTDEIATVTFDMMTAESKVGCSTIWSEW